MIKIVEIVASATTEGFDAVSGIKVNYFNSILNTTPFKWGDLIYEKPCIENDVLEKKDDGTFLTWIDEFEILEKNDNIKDLKISCDLLKIDYEKIKRNIADSLLVFIPNGFLHSNKPRLAGKYPNEAILLVSEGDTFQLCKNFPPKSQEITTFIVKRENLVFSLEKVIKTKKYEI